MIHEDKAALSRRGLLIRGGQAGALLGLAPALAACGGGSTAATAAPGGKPRRGGTLRVGISDATGGKLHDPQNQLAGLDGPLALMMYDQPAVMANDGSGRYALAEEITSNRTATEWTFRLRSGVEFHNGKTMSADDLIFTVQRALNKAHPTTSGSVSWGWANPQRMRKLDELTVRFSLDSPYSIVFDQMYNSAQILPVGFDETQPVGTGPFKFVSADPGQGANVARFDNYWNGAPYLDEVRITQFQDTAAEFNALLGGQIDAIDNVNEEQLSTVKSNSSLVLQTAATIGGNARQIEMITTMAPFTDNRVRQAMRLLADRKQMIAQVFPNQAQIGNDVWTSAISPDYNSALPQREQDPEQAKYLLKQAGREHDSFQLATISAYSGMAAAAESFAAQATAAGVNVAVAQKDPTTYYSSAYLTYPFFVSAAGGSWPYLINASAYLATGAEFNETKWSDPAWQSLYNTALKTVDPRKRLEVEHAMQKIEWDQGGTLMWGWADQLSAYSTRFAGYPTYTRQGFALNYYNFQKVYAV